MRLRHLALPMVALLALVAVIATVDPAASRNGRDKSHTNKLERTVEKMR